MDVGFFLDSDLLDFLGSGCSAFLDLDFFGLLRIWICVGLLRDLDLLVFVGCVDLVCFERILALLLM